MFSVDFDNIIYSLQRFGGASVYWKNLVSRVSSDTRFFTHEIEASTSLRFLPVLSNADIFHSSHFRPTIFSRSKVVTTAHDFTYEYGYLADNISSKINIAQRKLSYFNADAIICISDNTKNDLLYFYPQLEGRCSIHVIHHGFSPISLNDKQEFDLIHNDFLLFVGQRSHYKNFQLALFGFIESGLINEGFKLVCTGAPFSVIELDLFNELGVSNAIINMGILDQVSLTLLYKNAFALLYTSRYEGFGLPLVEAMSLGCPIIASNASCIPEIVGNAATLVDPDNPIEVANAILALGDTGLRSAFIDNGIARSHQFSWERSASSHMDVYASLLI